MTRLKSNKWKIKHNPYQWWLVIVAKDVNKVRNCQHSYRPKENHRYHHLQIKQRLETTQQIFLCLAFVWFQISFLDRANDNQGIQEDYLRVSSLIFSLSNTNATWLNNTIWSLYTPSKWSPLPLTQSWKGKNKTKHSAKHCLPTNVCLSLSQRGADLTPKKRLADRKKN